MPIIITIFVVALLGGTHYTAYCIGRNVRVNITKSKIKELFMLELENEKNTNSKREDTK